MVPTLFILTLEGALRLSGRHYPTAFFVKTPVPGQTTLVENDQFSRRYFAPELVRIPKPVAFQPNKSPDTLRVFVFGESAAEGDPGPAFGFARILQVLLRERYPDRKIEVLNTAVTAINSHVILPIARECADYGGDVWILYMGNNEAVGPFGSGTVFSRQAPGRTFIRANLALKTTSVGQLLDDWIRNQSRKQTSSPQVWEGMEMFLLQQVRHDDPRMEAVYRHFERNIVDIIRAGNRSGARVIVSTVGSSLRDCAPFASLSRSDLSSKQKDEWANLYRTGVAQQDRRDFPAAMETYARAAAIDDGFAELHFRLARCHAALGHREKACEQYERARDLDTLRFRADSRINQIIRRVASVSHDDKVALVDADAAFSRDSVDGVPGAELILDHVHLTFRGNYLLALECAEVVARWCQPHDSAPSSPKPNPWLSMEGCADRLALTDWERLMMAEDVGRRRQRPPFTSQADHSTQQKRWEQRMADLRARAGAADSKTVRDQFNRALAKAGEDWRLEQNLAVELLRQNDRNGAAQHFRRVIQLLPHYLPAYDFLGSILLEENQSAEAVATYQQALALSPDYFDGRLGLGQALVRQGKLDGGILQFRRAADAQPQSARALNLLGLTLAQAGRRDEARQEFLAAVQAEPDFVAARINLGNALWNEGKAAAAITHFQEVVRLDASNSIAHLALAKALARAGHPDDALRHYREAVQAQPEDFRVRAALAQALANGHRLPESIEHFIAAARLQPNSAEAQNNLGTALAGLGRRTEAMIHFSAALRLSPGFALAHLNLGSALLEENRVAEAIVELREAVRLEPENPRARQLIASALNLQKAGGTP